MTPPATIAHYRIVSKLGEGGMGAVYRATDTKLNRDVAIKTLPPAFAEDAARMARFEREAQVLASLNHPNIAAIYGIEQGAIVMELVEGTNLAGPVPVDTAIAYAKQIAAGLEAAHEKGIIHRDLKPANIKVTRDGVVKLLDFGLAKATDEAPPTVNATVSPTLSMAMTQAGMILGTAAYMSPEQARGKPVDRRADIWAFGVVMFELLTGRAMFGGGETVTDTIASVMKEDPDWKALPADTPPRLRRLMQRCLRKDPKQRLRDIGDARLTLEEAEPAAQSPEAAATPRRPWLPWAAAVLGLAAAAATIAILAFRPKPADPPIARFRLALPESTREASSPAATHVVPSPDGRYIAFDAISKDGATSSLWIRPLGSPAARRIEKTEGAQFPFWSPDSQSIGYFTADSLKKVALAGGSPQQICPLAHAETRSDVRDGGTWNRDGVIVFANGGANPLMRVPASGGAPTPFTDLDTKAGEGRHIWPQFLPDGRHVLYYALGPDPEHGAVYVQELGSTKRVHVMSNALHALWSPPGYLLYPRDGTLFAQAMDPKTYQLTGDPVSVAEDLSTNESRGRAAFAVSGNGVLVYRGGVINRDDHLAWYGRDGKPAGVVGKAGPYGSVRLSPDEKTAVVSARTSGHYELWSVDLGTGVLSLLRGDDVSSILGPWSPDLLRMASNSRPGKGVLVLTLPSGVAKNLTPERFYANDWSPDGRLILCTSTDGKALVAFPAAGGPPQAISETPYRKTEFRFAPDGKSVAYQSSESGHVQIVVASFPSFADKRVVADEGLYPRWRKDGKELFFVRRTQAFVLHSVEIQTSPKIESGQPKPLFTLPQTAAVISPYAASGDGQRLLVLEPDQPAVPAQIMVVVNWASELKH